MGLGAAGLTPPLASFSQDWLDLPSAAHFESPIRGASTKQYNYHRMNIQKTPPQPKCGMHPKSTGIPLPGPPTDLISWKWAFSR